MCHTAHTAHLICLHITTTTSSCRTLFTLLFVKCVPKTTELFLDEFCPRCQTFWDHHDISETSRRERALEFRSRENYHGPMTPSAVPARDGSACFFRFLKDGEGDGKKEVVEGGTTKRSTENVVEGEPEYMSELNAKWGKNPGPDSTMPKQQKRRGSEDSRITLWPGNTPNKNKKLGPDEFGNDSDVGSDWSRGDGVIAPEEIDLEVLDRKLRRSEAARLKPIAPMPASTPQRRESL